MKTRTLNQKHLLKPAKVITKVDDIEIAFPKRTQKVSGYILGLLGIHRGVDLDAPHWVLIHLPTGMAVFKRCKALKHAKTILTESYKFDWRGDGPKILDKPKNKKLRMREWLESIRGEYGLTR